MNIHRRRSSGNRCRLLPSAFLCLAQLIISSALSATPADGEWHIKITGTNLFFYGTRILTAGLKQRWQVDMEIHIRDGQFDTGTGRGSLLGKPEPYSRPEKMFNCRAIEGSYLDRGLNTVEMPHMRYEGFPVAGKIVNGDIILEPGVEYIGNFIAMMYECSTTDRLADVWLERGRLSATERAKRLGATVAMDGSRATVKIKEIQSMAPRGAMQLPLTDGHRFRLYDQAAMSEVEYSVSRLKQAAPAGRRSKNAPLLRNSE